jgi:MSHA biogenesis protein MshQ
MKKNLRARLHFVLLLLFSFAPITDAIAACSAYAGKVVFNEVYKPASGGGSFVEIKVLDPSVLAATNNFASWKIDLYAGNNSTMQQVSVSSGFTSSTVNTCGTSSLWIRFPDTVLSFLSSQATPYNLVLYDSTSGKQIVDIMRLGITATSFYGAGSTYQACSAIESQLPAAGTSNTQYDAMVATSGASQKDWYRVPDGTGPWTGSNTSGSFNTSCGSNDGTTGTFSVAKTSSVKTVAPNTNFSYTLYSYNGATAVTSPASVAITDDLNTAGLTFVSCTTTRGTCTNAGGIVTWTVGAVAANTSYTATLTVQAATTGAKINAITTNVTGVAATALAVNVITPMAEFRMEEVSWNGTAGEVKDNSATYHATAGSLSATKPVTTGTTPAIAGDPGTCRYGVFNRTNKDYIALPSGFPNLGTQSFTVTAWIKTTNNTLSGQRIFVDDENNTGGFGFSLGDGGQGRLRFYSRGTPSAPNLDTANVIANSTWYFVAIAVDVPNKLKWIYVYNASGTLLSSVSSAWTEASFGVDNGIASIGGETNASGENTSSYGFAGNIDEVRFYQAAMNASELNIVRQLTHPCPVSAAIPARFNCVETGAAADTGHLYTRLADTAFSFDVAALKTDGTVEAGYVAGSSKNVTVELGYATDTSCTAWVAASPAVSQTLTFAATDLGRKAAANMTVSSAYANLRCRVTDANQAPSVIACSTDNFAVRPIAFAVTSADATADGSGTSSIATPVIKAGANFNLTATAVAGYNGTAKIDATKVVAKSGSAGILADSFVAANILTGISNSASSTYSEVGYFNFSANGVYDDTFTAVDQPGDCTNDFSGILAGEKYGCKFGNVAASSYFGRFIPDHFDTITSGGMPCPNGLTCPTQFDGFVYSGQAFTTQVTARNLAGTPTQNYDSARGYSKPVTLSAWDAKGGTAVTPPGGGAISVNAVAATAFNLGVATSSTPVYTFPSVTVAPTDIYVRASEPTGADGVTSLRTVAADSVEGGMKIVSGRIKVANAYGSEYLPLKLRAAAQYYTASGWVNSTTDSLTSLTLGLSTYQCKTGCAWTTTLTPASGQVNTGVLLFNLSKPTGGGTGSVDVSITAPDYLLAGSNGAGVIPSISGRATFGVYKGRNDFIYQRESY